MKKISEMNDKEINIIEYIVLIICIIGLIVDVGIIIENIIWYDDYSPAVIILASIAIACAICAIINDFNNKKGE